MSGPSVKVPVDWLDSDAVEQLGADTVLLALTALGYSARQTTNGVVPRRQLRKLWPVDDVDQAIAQLVDAGEVEDRGDELLFVHWDAFILAGDEVEKIRAASRERTERSRRHQRGDHSLCTTRCWVRRKHDEGDHSRCEGWCVTGNGTGDVTGNATGDVTSHVSDGDPIRTDPTRPDPTIGGSGGTGRGSGGRRADGSASGATPSAGSAPEIGIVRATELTAEDGTYEAGHIEVTIGILGDNPEQAEPHWQRVHAVLVRVVAALKHPLEETKDHCDCEGITGAGCMINDPIDEDDWEDMGPRMFVTFPATEYLKWQKHIATAVKTAIAVVDALTAETA